MEEGLPQSLEQVRQKLQQLTTSLQSLHYRIGTTPDELPPLQTIASSLKVIFTQLASLTETVRTAGDGAVVVHPRATFPIATHEPLLTTLIRTRGLPETERREEMALADGQLATEPSAGAVLTLAAEGEANLDLYTASEWVAAQRERRLWTGYYTKRETEAAFEIDRDDVDDIRRARQQDQERARAEMGLMLRFARRGA